MLNPRTAIGALFVLSLLAACADPECPDGYYKLGKLCKRLDGGEAIAAGDGGSEPTLDAATSEDSATASDSGDSAIIGVDGSSFDAAGIDAAISDATTGVDAAVAEAGVQEDAAADAGAVPECDTARPCSAGYVCAEMKCVSSCVQTQCDPNATCSLVASKPTCACNAGFIAVPAAGGAVSCVRDVACEELGCHTNAACQVGANQVRTCVCKNGYTGDGKTCNPVSCPAPGLTNGKVNASGGITYGKEASYTCNTGYLLPGSVASITRTCTETGQWSGSEPACTIVRCVAPSSPMNGSCSADGLEYGDTATCTCSTNYTLSDIRPRTCQANGTWSAAPSCNRDPYCGDGIVSMNVGERCDPKAAGSSIWRCDPVQCQPTTFYNSCDAPNSGDQGSCSFGEKCLGLCTKICKSVSECQAPPSGSGLSAGCSGFCFPTGCSRNSDCESGLVCNKTGSVPTCSPCSDTAACSAGFRCQYASWSTVLGRCVPL